MMLSRNWYKTSGSYADVVISTRVRLARNLSHYPFPGRMSNHMQEELIDEFKNVMTRANSVFSNNYSLVQMDGESEVNRRALTEQHLISSEFETSNQRRALILNQDHTVSIMINEEDHLRIQCIMSGLAIDECYGLASTMDDYLDRNMSFAFHEKYGYLTQCPTNVGTGMRVSVMVNLPALFLSGKMASIVQSLSKIGLTVRGLYGEGSLPYGNIYQISNQVTLGVSEHEIVEKLTVIARQLIENERNTRRERIIQRKDHIEDYCYRCLGLLKTARIMTAIEAINIIAGVRYGVSTGLLPYVDYALLNELMVKTQNANIILEQGKQEMTEHEMNLARAEFIRNKLKDISI